MSVILTSVTAKPGACQVPPPYRHRDHPDRDCGRRRAGGPQPRPQPSGAQSHRGQRHPQDSSHEAALGTDVGCWHPGPLVGWDQLIGVGDNEEPSTTTTTRSSSIWTTGWAGSAAYE